MKNNILLLLSLVISQTIISAEVLTVDNNPGSVAMYTAIKAAHDAATPGDTILVAGSATTYGQLNSYKKLNWVGPGSFLATNGVPGLSTNSAQMRITFKKDGFFGDSSDSTITGMNAEIKSDATVSGLVVDKCTNESPNYGWIFAGPVSITRSMNKGANVVLTASGSSITNSIITGLYLRAENIIVDHCVVRNIIETRDTCTISNTIFHELTNANNWDSVGNASYSYCLMIGASFLPNGSGNINGQFVQAVLRATGSTNSDAYYQLLEEGSAASGAGLGGADIGAFGGSNPYVLSGVPGIPRITRLTVPSTATGLTALTFEVEARAYAE